MSGQVMRKTRRPWLLKVNAEMSEYQEKDWSGIGIFTVNQLCQSGIRVSPVQLVKD
jgi:hypothetical protein